MPPNLRALLRETTGDVRELPDVPAITRRGRNLVWRRRGFRLAVTGAAAIAVVLASSRIDMFEAAPLPPVEEAPTPQRVPPLEPSSPLEVGVYGANDFVIPFTLQIEAKNWFVGVITPTWVYVTRRGFHVHVQRWERVLTARGPRPLPEDLVAWFQKHPGISVVRTQPTEIGTFAATLVDIRARRASTRTHPECPTTRCLILARVEEHEEAIDIRLAETARFYVVDTPGAPVIIYWHVPTRQLGGLEPVLDPVARSINFL